MGESVVVYKYPRCDTHEVAFPDEEVPEAHFDSRIGHNGPWAYMCQRCFDLLGPGILGTGFAQRLVTREDSDDYS